MILDEEIEKPQGPELSDREIFIEIWTSPRKVFRFIHEYAYSKHTVWLLILGGALSALDRNNYSNLGDFNVWLLLFGALIAGASLGWIGYWISAFLFRLTGSWLGGKANTAQLLRVIAYSALPSIPSTALIIPLFILFGESILLGTPDVDTYGSLSTGIYYGVLVLQFAMGVWSFIFSLVGISVAQGFSLGRAFGNIMLAVLVMLVPILTLVFIFIDTLAPF